MKTIRTLLAAFAVLVLCSGAAYATETEYKVKRGETLWGISHRTWGTGKLWQEIAKENKISDPKKLKAGQTLRIPEIKETIKITNYNTAPYGARAVKGDLRILAAIDKTFYSAEVKKDLQKFVSENSPSPYILMKGEKVECASDKAGVYCLLGGFEFAWEKIGALRADVWSTELGNRKYEVFVIEICGNFASRSVEVPQITIEIPPVTEILAPPEPTPTPPEPLPPVTEEKVPGKPKITFTTPLFSIAPKFSIAMHKPIACRDYELNARQGFWWGDSAHGEFSYIEGGIWDTCWGWGRMIGFYANRDSGEVNDTAFKWDSWGAGPQVGLRYLDLYTRKDGTIGFHGFTSKLRLIYANISGENPEVAYRMSQEDIMLGLYAEYVRQLSQKTTVAATFEVWISLQRHMETTFRGDTPSNRGQIQLGGYVQHKLSKDWAIRNGGNLFHHMWDREQGIGVFSEIRYQNFLLAGFAVNVGFESGLNYGPYAGIEAGNKWRERADRKIEDGIWSIDANGNPLNANSEDQIWDTSATACADCVPVPKEQNATEILKVQEIPTTEIKVVDSSQPIQLDKEGEPVTLADQANFDRKVSEMAWPFNKQM